MQINMTTLPHFVGDELPFYATDMAAGMDLKAAISKPITLNPMERRLIPCGFQMALPQGYEAQIRPRSGLSFKNGITVLNAPGTIDADYRGEIQVLLVNLSQEPFEITSGMRVAQMVVAPVTQISWHQVDTLESTARQDGGFGSTGLQEKQARAS